MLAAIDQAAVVILLTGQVAWHRDPTVHTAGLSSHKIEASEALVVAKGAWCPSVPAVAGGSCSTAAAEELRAAPTLLHPQEQHQRPELLCQPKPVILVVSNLALYT